MEIRSSEERLEAVLRPFDADLAAQPIGLKFRRKHGTAAYPRIGTAHLRCKVFLTVLYPPTQLSEIFGT